MPVPSRDAAFFVRKAFSARVMVLTEALIKGKPERKLVLQYTRDVESSEEVKWYRKQIGS